MKRVIIVGSPRSNGRSAHLAEMLFEANIDERPEDELYLVPISEIDVGPCIGCGACKKQSPVTFLDDDGAEVTEMRNRCIFDDDMQTLYDLLDEADALTIVCPIYFSGTPGPMKCVLDRLQPYFWPYCANGPREPKRPLELHVIGEGGDPHGYAPLVSEVRGPTALAGFRLERIFDWVGKISPAGEILEEAEEVELAKVLDALKDLPGAAGGSAKTIADAANEAADATNAAADADARAVGEAAGANAGAVGEAADANQPDAPQPKVEQVKPYGERPKLSFSNNSEKTPVKAQGKPGGKTQGKSSGQSLGKASNQSRGKAQDLSQGQSKAQSRGKAKSQPQSQPHGKKQTQSHGQSKAQSHGKAQGQSHGKAQNQSRGQASKQKRGRAGGKDGRHG